MNERTKLPVNALIPLILVVISGVPLIAAGLPLILLSSPIAKLCFLSVVPVIFSLVYVALTGLVSTPFQKGIISGKFPRDVTHVVYSARRIYGLCWCAVFYFTPVYYAFLSVPSLRRFMLRSFGYKGHPEVIIAPDAWIRDLPLLNFGEGAYAANKCTIGTNLCLSTGHILVGEVTLGKKVTVGHLAMIALGCRIADQSEIGFGCAIGLRTSIGAGTKIGPTTTVNHGAEIGSKVEIGTMSYVGVKAKIADGVVLPGGSTIPDGAEIKSQEDAKAHSDTLSRILHDERMRLAQIYTARASAS
jgi:carbonic anhydrase/acetyltransferase-like protein (isoleucine patch superfamily)